LSSAFRDLFSSFSFLLRFSAAEGFLALAVDFFAAEAVFFAVVALVDLETVFLAAVPVLFLAAVLLGAALVAATIHKSFYSGKNPNVHLLGACMWSGCFGIIFNRFLSHVFGKEEMPFMAFRSRME